MQVGRGLALEDGATVETEAVEQAMTVTRYRSRQNRRSARERRPDLLESQRDTTGEGARRIDAPDIDRRGFLVLARQQMKRRILAVELAAHEPIDAFLVEHQERDISFAGGIPCRIAVAPRDAPEAIRIMSGDPLHDLVGGAAAHLPAGARNQGLDVGPGGAEYNQPLRQIYNPGGV